MTTGVIGGTGMIGNKVVELLAVDGQKVRILSRTPPSRMIDGVSHSVIDLSTGEGLEAGLEGLDTVIDVGNAGKNPDEILVAGTRRVLDTCANQGVNHYVGISIIGCENIAMGYYKAKSAQEAVIRSSPIGWSLLRATQFHELIDSLFRSAAKRRLSPRSGIPLQTVAASEAAKSIVEIAGSAPTSSDTEIAGPQIQTVSEMGAIWRKAMNRRTIPLPLPAIGKSMKSLKHGGLTDPDNKGSGPTFAEWLLAE